MSEKELEKKLEKARDRSRKLKGKNVNQRLARKAVTGRDYQQKEDEKDLDLKLKKKNDKWRVVLLNEYGNVVKSKKFPDKFTALRHFYWKKYPEVCINGMCTDSKNNYCEEREDCRYWQDNEEEIEKRWPYWSDKLNDEYDMFDEVESNEGN